ncbi:MAG: dTDP-glucose 4,6-dehydratase [Methanomicrobiales archaeon]
MKILVTGGAGFIGTNFIRYWLKKYPEPDITVLDKLTYAGRRENLGELPGCIQFIQGDICDKVVVSQAMDGCNIVFHFAAESHVDRSIENAGDFVRTNITGTYTLLEAAKAANIDRFIHISTDEVYGSTFEGSFSEDDPLMPSSPYSATKAGSDLLALSYHMTHGLPVIVTRSSNNYGPYQYPEKMIPLMILNALENKKLPVYGDGKNIRDWLFVEDNCAGIDTVAQKGRCGEIYNLGAQNEYENIEIIRKILNILDKPEDLITYVRDRPGHDRRYSLQTDKVAQLGWKPEVAFDEGLQKTISWYCDHKNWWKPIRG